MRKKSMTGIDFEKAARQYLARLAKQFEIDAKAEVKVSNRYTNAGTLPPFSNYFSSGHKMHYYPEPKPVFLLGRGVRVYTDKQSALVMAKITGARVIKLDAKGINFHYEKHVSDKARRNR